MNSLQNTDLTDIERAFWENTYNAHNITQTITDIVVGGLRDLNTTPTQMPPAVDLTSLSYEQIIQHLIDVQTVKLQYRGYKKLDGSCYITYYQQPLNDIYDVCSETIIYNGRIFILELRYDGGNNARQPGNCILREPGGPLLRYNQLPGGSFDSPAIYLLFFTEIVRRKAVDTYRNLQDPFQNLPISLGISMAYKLLIGEKIQFGEFWLNDGNYHIFSGDYQQRWARFRNLSNVYYNHYISSMQDPAAIMHHLRTIMLDFYTEPERYLEILFADTEL